MTSVVVSGAIANKPGNGGNAWVPMTYVIGLRRLGCRTHFLEQIAPAACTAEAVRYFDDVIDAFGLAEDSALLGDDGSIVVGPPLGELRALAEDADLLLNLNNLTYEPLFSCFRHRAYLDTDPGYTQLWLSRGHSVNRVAEHQTLFTVGTNVGTPRCPLPDCGLSWRPTVPPVLLDEWPLIPGDKRAPITTVASWRGAYGRLEHDDELYTQKAHEFRKLVELPERAGGRFELALEIEPPDEPDRALMGAHGWQVVDARQLAGSPQSFREYVQASSAELSPAQGVYVESQSGWLSDRTTRYLATGRPAIVQDTGLDSSLRSSEGLLTFRTPDDAVAAIKRIRSDYDVHHAAARAFAERQLASDRVLALMLEEVEARR